MERPTVELNNLEEKLNQNPVVIATLNATQETIARYLNIQVDYLEAQRVHFVAPDKVSVIHSGKLGERNALAKLLTKQELPLGLVFDIPSTVTYSKTDNIPVFYFSSEYFNKLATLSPKNASFPSIASDLSLKLFHMLYRGTVHLSTQELEFPRDPRIISFFTQAGMKMLAEKSDNEANTVLKERISETSKKLEVRLTNPEASELVGLGLRIGCRLEGKDFLYAYGSYHSLVLDLLSDFAEDYFVRRLGKSLKKQFLKPAESSPIKLSSTIFMRRNKDEAAGLIQLLSSAGITDSDGTVNHKALLQSFLSSQLALQAFELLKQDIEEKEIEESLKQLKIHGIGQPEEEQPLIAYQATADDEIESDEQAQQIPEEEDDLQEDRSVVSERKNGRNRIRPD